MTKTRSRLADGEGEQFTLSATCPGCGSNAGIIRDTGLHVGLYCAECDRWQRWLSKRDAGIEHRSLASRRNITASVRARVLERDGYRCVLCGFGPPERRLVIGHIVSVKEGYEIGISDRVLYHELNLAAMCEECNAGLGKRSLAVPEALRLYHRWLLKQEELQS